MCQLNHTMNSILKLFIDYDAKLIKYATEGNMTEVIACLNRGANVASSDNRALRMAAISGHDKIVKILIQHDANVHAYENYALRQSFIAHHIKVVQVLLENGANLHANNDVILKRMCCFKFNKSMALALLPYCSTADYQYFPPSFIEQNVICTKNAQSIK